MKATGIVRRIDDLGRVVIPKEIRRTMRIREGDPLEIFTNVDGQVVFKKYSPIGELKPFAVEYADVLYRAIGLPVAICDRDHVVTSAGITKKENIDRKITKELEDMMESRRSVSVSDEGFEPIEGIEMKTSVSYPIIASGDVIGAVCLMSPDTGKMPDDADIKLVQVAANFLGRQIEE